MDQNQITVRIALLTLWVLLTAFSAGASCIVWLRTRDFPRLKYIAILSCGHFIAFSLMALGGIVSLTNAAAQVTAFQLVSLGLNLSGIVACAISWAIMSAYIMGLVNGIHEPPTIDPPPLPLPKI